MTHPANFPIAYPPPGWHHVDNWGEGHCFAHKNGLRVLIDCARKRDGNLWLHVSYSRRKWSPSHEDTVMIKEAFIGDDHYAYAVFPPKEHYVNLHAHCLHLWARVGGSGQVLPEFSGELAALGKSI